MSLSISQGFVIYGAVLQGEIGSTAKHEQGFYVTGSAGGRISGFSRGGVGDFNGDGINDVIVGSTLLSSKDCNQCGTSYLIYGQQTLSNNHLLDFVSTNMAFIGSYSYSGSSVNTVGSGTTTAVTLDTSQGFTTVGSGPSSGCGEPHWNYSSEYFDLGFSIFALPANSFSGYSVSGGGDVNGDGDNLASYSQSQVYCISGAHSSDLTGLAVNVVGDFNGDDLADLVIGAPFGNFDSGDSYLILSSPSPTSFPSSFPTTMEIPVITLQDEIINWLISNVSSVLNSFANKYKFISDEINEHITLKSYEVGLLLKPAADFRS
eukprot:gene17491-23044_t